MEQAVEVGQAAPDFSLQASDGKVFKLSEQRGKIVVLYFYPKDDTPGCTAESCAFRDAYEDFKKAGAVVVGVSSDSGESHVKFAAKHRLPFTLLSDEGGKIRKLYGVKSSLLGLMPGRVTYVIDRQGVVRHEFNSQFQATRHVREALEVIAGL